MVGCSGFLLLTSLRAVRSQMRDLRQVGDKLKVVLLPRDDRDAVITRLKECACAGFRRTVSEPRRRL